MCGPRAKKSKNKRKMGSKWVRFGSLFGYILVHFLDQNLSPFLMRFQITFGPIWEAPSPRKCGNYRMKRMSPIFGQRAVFARFQQFWAHFGSMLEHFGHLFCITFLSSFLGRLKRRVLAVNVRGGIGFAAAGGPAELKLMKAFAGISIASWFSTPA